MPLGVWLLLLAFAGSPAYASTPVVQSACANPLRILGDLSSVPPATLFFDTLVDGTAFDPSKAHHALAHPLLAIRGMFHFGLLGKDSPMVEIRWGTDTLWVWAAENSITGDYSPVGEHCPDVDFIVTNVTRGTYLTFHAFTPMLYAILGPKMFYADLAAYHLTLAELEAVFGQDRGNR